MWAWLCRLLQRKYSRLWVVVNTHFTSGESTTGIVVKMWFFALTGVRKTGAGLSELPRATENLARVKGGGCVGRLYRLMEAFGRASIAYNALVCAVLEYVSNRARVEFLSGLGLDALQVQTLGYLLEGEPPHAEAADFLDNLGFLGVDYKRSVLGPVAISGASSCVFP